MTEQEVGFIVDSVVRDGFPMSLGRCGDAPIHVGVVVDAVFHDKPGRDPDETRSLPEPDIEKPASVRLIGIDTHRRSLDCLGEGMTCLAREAAMPHLTSAR